MGFSVPPDAARVSGTQPCTRPPRTGARCCPPVSGRRPPTVQIAEHRLGVSGPPWGDRDRDRARAEHASGGTWAPPKGGAPLEAPRDPPPGRGEVPSRPPGGPGSHSGNLESTIIGRHRPDVSGASAAASAAAWRVAWPPTPGPAVPAPGPRQPLGAGYPSGLVEDDSVSSTSTCVSTVSGSSSPTIGSGGT